MMRVRSLRLRLLAGAVVVIILALAVTGLGLSSLFSRHLERRVGQELDTHLAQIIGNIRLSGTGTPSLAREPGDPRFQQIFGGLYWQVGDDTTGGVLRSRSLWDFRLSVPGDTIEPGAMHVHDLAGPDGIRLLAHEQLVILAGPEGDHRLRVTVAIDRREIADLASGFARDAGWALFALGAVLITGFWVQVTSGLTPVRHVLDGVAAIRTGRARRMKNDNTPTEIAPLVDEVNKLLDAQDAEMNRARDRAADLAHGLKTPLTALGADIARLRERGETGIADDIDELAARMRRHMERELARARLRHGRSGVQSEVGQAVNAIVRTLKRTPAGEAIVFGIDIHDAPAAQIDAEDLNEIVGNLAENAVRHAKARVDISARRTGRDIALVIADDGEGLTDAARDAVLERGARLDMSGTGAGLGLAIVGDILAACGGQLTLGRSDELGGLEATVTLPAAPVSADQ